VFLEEKAERVPWTMRFRKFGKAALRTGSLQRFQIAGKSVQEVADVLDRLDELGASQERVTVDDVQECLGRDAFGPALLTLGLLALSPIGDIPGAPTIFAIFIFGVGVQMAAGRITPWLPPAHTFRCEAMLRQARMAGSVKSRRSMQSSLNHRRRRPVTS
jgi:hypothetical protein